MANSIVLTEAQVLSNLSSEQEFPVDFDSAWQWAGYSRKNNALRKLKEEFSEGDEFCSMMSKTPEGGRPSVLYYLTNDCFKMFCMMAGTDEGRKVRRYYLNCEKKLKEIQAAPPALPVPTVAEQATMLFAAFQGFGLTDSPRHMQLAKDHIGNLLSPKTLPPSEAPWLGVVEIAEAMGYNKYQVSQVCSGLGRVVAAWYRGEAGDEPATEDRLVSGRTCSLKVYKRSEDLDTIIAAYLTAKGLEAA